MGKKSKTGLFGRYKDDGRLTKLTLDALTRFYGISKIIDVPEFNSYFVQGDYDTGYGLFTLCDNGGEINVGKPNDPNWITRGIASDSTFFGLTPFTMAYRIAKTINGKFDEIDWTYNETDQTYFDKYAKEYWPQ